ncbi:MAG: hypothetical protein ACHQD9_01640 [Chitinophagales bacterium]
MEPVYYIPLFTCTLSIIFSIQLYRHWRTKKDSLYLFWWMLGVLTFGAGTFTESFNTLTGWHEWNFKAWYITGALLGGAPLAQGTVYLLLKRRTANILTAIFLSLVIIASTCVILSPVDHSKVVPLRFSGNVFVWQWVRYFSPFINLYALIFLVGGAIYSAILYFSRKGSSVRAWGNVLIAVGALLPGIGGSATRLGHVEVLYITEFIGLCLIFSAYLLIKKDSTTSVHSVQKQPV